MQRAVAARGSAAWLVGAALLFLACRSGDSRSQGAPLADAQAPSMIVVTVTAAQLAEPSGRPADPEATLWKDKAHRISEDPPTFEITGLATQAPIDRLRAAGFPVRIRLDPAGYRESLRRLERETNPGRDAG